jgi:hypothetical protein
LIQDPEWNSADLIGAWHRFHALPATPSGIVSKLVRTKDTKDTKGLWRRSRNDLYPKAE